ncbi:MAG TPA: peptidase M22 [Ruminiclostridium sp.]|nr:peptidase M22 [Ruminiclostridium sp.]
MPFYLGIDTSNYTTSTALLNTDKNKVFQQKKLLEVKEGQKGLRQSEALFQHVRELPGLLETLLGFGCDIKAVGYSSKPRDAEDSYMPCFLAGGESARSIAAVTGIPCYAFSHQAGHIAAALYSIDKLQMLNESFIAFHVSGGTTDVVLIKPGEDYNFKIMPIASSLDLKAGQAVDRVGLLLGLAFPAGPALEKLALESQKKFQIHPCLKDADCCLSGIENICSDMIKSNKPPCDVARYCIEYIKLTLDEMAQAVLERLGNFPMLFAGGVMSDSIIRDYMTEKYGALFAKPGFSSDNAAGIAALTKIKTEGL